MLLSTGFPFFSRFSFVAASQTTWSPCEQARDSLFLGDVLIWPQLEQILDQRKLFGSDVVKQWAMVVAPTAAAFNESAPKALWAGFVVVGVLALP